MEAAGQCGCVKHFGVVAGDAQGFLDVATFGVCLTSCQHFGVETEKDKRETYFQDARLVSAQCLE